MWKNWFPSIYISNVSVIKSTNKEVIKKKNVVEIKSNTIDVERIKGEMLFEFYVKVLSQSLDRNVDNVAKLTLELAKKLPEYEKNILVNILERKGFLYKSLR